MFHPFVGLLFATQEGGGAGASVWLLNLGLIALIFYFLLFRPHRKEQQRHRAMVESLQKGDEVVMAGGLVGTVVHVAPDRLTLKTADNTRVVVDRMKVGHKLTDEEA